MQRQNSVKGLLQQQTKHLLNVACSKLHLNLDTGIDNATMPPSRLSVDQFVHLAWEDHRSPTTSSFTAHMGSCKETLNALDEGMDHDRSAVLKIKKAIKAGCNSGEMHIQNENLVAASLAKLGENVITREHDQQLGHAFGKFSIVTKELSGLLQNLVQSMRNMLLFPLDLLVKGDTRDLKKPFEKACKDYDAKFTKIEREKKKLAMEAGMMRTEISGAEIADEMERERRVFQLQMCEYILKANEYKTKKGVELLQHLVEYYQAQTNYFRDGLKTMEHFNAYIEQLLGQLSQVKTVQETERRGVQKLRDTLKTSLSQNKEAGPTTGTIYNLHQLQGNKLHGNTKEGYLLKKSEGMRKMWQRRRCSVKEGGFFIRHSDEAKDPVRLNLLTCQIKLVPGDTTKRCFDVISGTKNRTYHFQAEDQEDMERWISVLNNAKEGVLLRAFGESGGNKTATVNSSVKELTQTIMRQVKNQPGNKVCADCGATDPEWLSVNLGVLICLECCGVHRDLGVHISRTQSVVIDDLATSELLIARVMGNRGFNDIMEAQLDPALKPVPNSPMEDKKSFIHAKYERRRYAIVTCTAEEELLHDLKNALVSRDIYSLLQVYAEGVDFLSPLPDMSYDETALHQAVRQEDGTTLHMVYFIIQNTSSQSLHLADQEGNTAAHVCARLNRTECLKLLLRVRPDLAELENKLGKTPMDIAREQDHQLCVQLLKAALSRSMDCLTNVNVDWDLIQEENLSDAGLDFSDDELDMPYDRRMSRPMSMILPTAENAKALDNLLKHHQSSNDNNNRRPTDHMPPPLPAKQHSGSTSTLPGLFVRGGSGKRKAPAPLPPGVKKGHARHPSDPGFRTQTSLIRRPSDPPPLPVKTSTMPPGAKLLLPPPSDFANVTKPPEQPKRPPPPRTPDPDKHHARNNNDMSQVHQRILVGGEPEPVPPQPHKKGEGGDSSPLLEEGMRCQALYDCEADDEDELTFEEGEVIIIVSKEEDQWWEGYIEGNPSRRGVFPGSYVKPLPVS